MEKHSNHSLSIKMEGYKFKLKESSKVLDIVHDGPPF